MKEKKKRLKRFLPLYIMMIPSILYLLVNNYLPMFGIILAFKKINYSKGILSSPWCGLKNFEFLFRTKDAWIIIRNTLGYNAVFIILNTVAAVVIAILLNEVISKKKKSFFQGAILLPHMLSWVVIAYIVYAFLAGEGGFVNSILNKFGAEGISWYTEPKFWPVIITLVNMWKQCGYLTIVYFAALVGIDASLCEAASVDGATKMQQIRYIILPALKPTIVTMILMQVGRICYSDFGLFYQIPMQVGVLINVTNTLDTYVYRALIQLGNIGMSSAAGFFQSVVGFIIVYAANMATRKLDPEDALF